MNILDSVINDLHGCKGNWGDIVSETGIPYGTLTKIAQRATRNPRIGSVQKLYDYFESRRLPDKQASA